jgi:transposase
MPKPLSYDLRARVLAAVDAGLSCRQPAERFGVSPSSAIRWHALRRSGGDARPKPSGATGSPIAPHRGARWAD